MLFILTFAEKRSPKNPYPCWNATSLWASFFPPSGWSRRRRRTRSSVRRRSRAAWAAAAWRLRAAWRRPGGSARWAPSPTPGPWPAPPRPAAAAPRPAASPTAPPGRWTGWASWLWWVPTACSFLRTACSFLVSLGCLVELSSPAYSAVFFLSLGFSTASFQLL